MLIYRSKTNAEKGTKTEVCQFAFKGKYKETLRPQNPSTVCLNLNDSAKKSGSKLLPSDAREPLLVFANTCLQFLQPRAAPAITMFKVQLLFHIKPGRSR